MSVGHQIPSEEEGVLPAGLRALITPEIILEVRRRVERARIVRADVPLVAGASNDNKTVYIDRRVADIYRARTIYGNREMAFEPAGTLPWHELGEQYFEEELGLGYLDGAHPIGDWFERQHVENDLGIEWASYQEIFEQLIPICRAHKPVDFPHDIRMQPYIEGGDPALLLDVLRALGKDDGPKKQKAAAAKRGGVRMLEKSAGATPTNDDSVDKGDKKADGLMSDFNLYLPIDLAKVDKTQHMVWGFASTPTLDLDNEIVKLEAIEEALPDYMEWRNIREMHQPIAVGVTKEATVKDEGLYIGAKIVDKDAWEKVIEGVYKGFSIGGRALSKVDNEITKLRLTEISLVDRPANPDCKIEVVKVAKARETEEAAEDGAKLWDKMVKFFKREFSQKERDSAADSGAAMPDGSFPIHNEKDLHNAIHLAGNSKHPDKARAHIKSRAAAIGHSDKIPDDWKTATADLNKRAVAFEKIREAQRALENDGADLALISKLGHIAQTLALAMGEEEIDLDVEDDKYLPEFDEDGVIEMAESPEEIRKRHAHAHKEAVLKARHHVDKAVDCQKNGMSALHAAHKMMKALETGDIEKSAHSLVGHLKKAHGHFSKAQDHHDIASSNLHKASHAWSSADIGGDWGSEDDELPSSVGGSIHEPTQPTEGHVPLIEADEVYPNKAAKGSISKAEHEALLQAAVAKATIESLTKQLEQRNKEPAHGPRARAFAIGKDAFPVGDTGGTMSDDPMSKLMKGVEAFDLENPEDRQRASARMFTNMIADSLNGGRTFGKSVFDPSFRGGAAGPKAS